LEVQASGSLLQGLPPLPILTGENIKTEDEGFDKWFELFEERAQFAGRKPEQALSIEDPAGQYSSADS
jgi:hypothetical protein